jgi:hypothetical protein
MDPGPLEEARAEAQAPRGVVIAGDGDDGRAGTAGHHPAQEGVEEGDSLGRGDGPVIEVAREEES